MNKRSSRSPKDIKSDVVLSKEEGSPVKKMSSTQKTVVTLLTVAFLASLGVAAYFYSQVNTLKTDPQKAAREEAKTLVERVGKLIVLPEGEEPTIATVTDPELLKDQPFFAKAKKGDKVLIYATAGKAILYDPAENKIVEVAPVNIGTPQAQASPPSEQPQTTQ